MVQRRGDLEEFFHPDGVAVIGGVDRTRTEVALRAAMDNRWGVGNWYLVNPGGGSIGSVPVHRSVADLPEPVTLAVISTPPAVCASVVEQCAEAGVRYALVFSSGFSEIGPDGAALEAALGEAGRRHNIRIFGPNTNTNAFEPVPEVPQQRGGKIGLVTQSGHNGRPIMQGVHFGIGFSRQIPCGNEVDLEVSDFIEYFAYDDDTAVIAGYVEGFRSAGKLRVALAAANAQNKPVVLLKMGATDAGSRMASSHTGHLTGSDAVIDGLFEQYGVVRVRDLDELLETAALFAKLGPDVAEGAGLYSISGGSGTLMAETAELAGVAVPRLAGTTREKLHRHIPGYLTVSNPVDNGGAFITSQPAEIRRQVIRDLSDDPSVGYTVVGVTGAVPPMTDLLGDDIGALAGELDKPIIATWNSFKVDEAGFNRLVESGVPLFRSFRGCFGALAAYHRYQRRRKNFRYRPPLPDALPDGAAAGLGFASADAGAAAGLGLDSADAAAVLRAFGLPLVAGGIAGSSADARRVAQDIGLPVVVKIASVDFPHKTDSGLVVLGVDSLDGVEQSARAVLDRARALAPGAAIDGVEVQPMVVGGTEMIVGVTRDPTLGPAVMVGTGGLFAEILADTAVRPLPMDEADAYEMIRSLRGFPLLDGARGRPLGDVEALVQVVMATATLATALGDHLAELDLNPVVVRDRGQGAIVLDHLMVVASRRFTGSTS
ncbi:acetate--CoA ligase family protein [Candidatus Poriferisocius sp.]|uniref:acetate--CoA ligase family protein n=1 Tax=Candidatus Poriferisocius sp. TaxID=3101276 RepID=UPI003B02D318